MEATINEIRRQIFTDGKIDHQDIVLLKKAMTEEGKVTLKMANLLFDIKDNVAQSKLPAGFKEFFVKAITSHLLDDEETPGEIDEEEAKWLRGKIQKNGKLDDFDKALLANLKENSINYPAILQYKSFRARQIEKLLYSTRYLSIIAVIGSVISSVILFIQGIVIIYEGLYEYFKNEHSESGSARTYELFEQIVSSVDVFLFALVLIIFGVGVYELFVTQVDPVEQNHDSRPSWLRISSVDDLKSSLGKVILMVLIVSFFKHVLEFTHWNEAISMLYMSIGIILIAGALYLAHKSNEEPGHESKSPIDIFARKAEIKEGLKNEEE